MKGGTCVDVGIGTYAGTGASTDAGSWQVGIGVQWNHSCGQLWRNYKF